MSLDQVPCIFLPSPHSRNPRFRLPWQQSAPPPPTPLNAQLLGLFADARRDIYMQTPNLTAPPVLDALREALKRGVAVTILTSEKLMILEQLVTAGTTTSRCVKHLINYHETLIKETGGDEEAGRTKPGRLKISYYVPRSIPSTNQTEPVQSHLKLTIIDNTTVVFGSGNMDRASWYTSQELGVAFSSEELAARTWQDLETAMAGRAKLVYDSQQA